MAKKNGMMQLVDKIVAQREQDIRFHARIFQLDMVTLALGRMGWGEKRLREFDKVLAEVAKEYSFEIISDSQDDKDCWFSKAKMDEELKQYTGSLFVPYDERYNWGGNNNGKISSK